MAKKNKTKVKKTKTVVAITSGDWHLHDWKNYNEDARRIKDSVTVIELLDRVCQRHGVPLLFTGDMFHIDQNIPARVIQYALPVMEKLLNIRTSPPFNIYGIDGNHDQYTTNTLDNPTPGYIDMLSHVFRGLNCVNFTSEYLADFTLHGIPYITRNKDFDKIVDSFELSTDRPNILMIHSDLPGAKDTNQRVVGTVRNIPEKMSEMFAKFDLVISGHIHKPQIMDDNVIMVGAPSHQRKTDIGCKMGYWKIFSDMSYEFVAFDCFPEFKLVEQMPEDDDHFYVLEKKTNKKLKDRGEENKRDFNVLMSRKKLVTNYMKEVGDTDKRRRQKLKTLIANA